jgi:hypothetical protein
MGKCIHIWEFAAGQSYNPQADHKMYKCTQCGAMMTDSAIVERLIYKIQSMRDGAESSIGEMLFPEKYGYTELAHICMKVVARAKSEGIILDAGETSNVFLQYHEKFKKRERKHLIIKKIFPKAPGGYKNGDSAIETTEIFVFDKVQIKYVLDVCCDEKMQTQQYFNHDCSYDISRNYAFNISKWCEQIVEKHSEYDMTNRTVVCPEHYNHYIVTIDNISYLLNSDDEAIQTLESLVSVDPLRREVESKRDQFLGIGAGSRNKSGSKRANLFGNWFKTIFKRK